jgi:hypothetical protein
MAPDLRRKVDAARAARLAREAEMKKQVEAQVSCSAEELPTFVLFSLFSLLLFVLTSWFLEVHPMHFTLQLYNFTLRGRG